MSRTRVLYVSSDPTMRAAAMSGVAEATTTVTTAPSATAGIAQFERDPSDVVVVDGTTVSNVGGLLATVEEHGGAAFVTWTGDGTTVSGAVDGVLTTASAAGPTDVIDSVVADVDRGTGSELDPVVEDIKSRLADARSPGAVERAIREGFTSTGTFEFAWVGEYDRGESGIIPWVTDSGIDWPITRSFSIGDGVEPMLERTIRSRELQEVAPLAADPSSAPLGSVAVDRGVDAVAVAPLATETEFYGVLVCYAAAALSPDERSALADVADTTSHVLEGVALRGQYTQQKQALRRYERLVETAGDGMYVLDDEGCFTTVNPALVQLSGYRREGLLGEPASILFGEQGDRNRAETIDALVRADESTETIELSVRTKEGTEVPCETQVAVLVHDERLLGSVGVVRDVTDRKRRERTLRRQNERLDAFASIVSHDLRNPLGIAQGYVELVEESGDVDHLENAAAALDRMESIVTDVLTIARQGEWVVETESVALDDAAVDAWENVSTEDASLSIDDTITLEADRSQFLRLLENLFRNSVEHGGPGVEVRVGSIAPGENERGSPTGRTGFYVEDDGPGMPAEVRDRVFDADFTTGSDGLGIGLWVVEEVANAHGWKSVATERDGGGARFEFVPVER